jgi:enoyl-CoA hydratase/carnithine racemase
MDNIAIEDAGRVRIVTLSRPQKKNAVSIALAKELAESLRAAGTDAGVGAVVVTGSGDAFCAGVDLALFADPKEFSAAGSVGSIHEAILGCGRPIIAMVNGLAVGMGVTLLPHFDLVYASENATFTTPFAKLGLAPEFGSTFTLPRLIGRQRAAELLLRGKPIDAATAAAWGLVTRTFPAARLREEVLSIAKDIAENPSNSIRRSREVLRAGEEAPTLQRAMSRESEVLSTLYGSEENVAAARAILARKG